MPPVLSSDDGYLINSQKIGPIHLLEALARIAFGRTRVRIEVRNKATAASF